MSIGKEFGTYTENPAASSSVDSRVKSAYRHHYRSRGKTSSGVQRQNEHKEQHLNRV